MIVDARQRGELAVSFVDLDAQSRSLHGAEYSLEALEQVVTQLAYQGLLVDLRLAGGNRVLLLQVEQVERYAGSIILLARDNPRGVPTVEQRKILSPDIVFPGIAPEQRLPRAAECMVLECVMQLLVDRNLCLLHEGLLVFPHLFRESAASAEPEAPHHVSIHYDFSGAIDNIYAALTIKLALSGRFGDFRLWENRSEYHAEDGGLYGLTRVVNPGGLGRLDLYFNDKTAPERRDLFITFIEDHLRTEGVTVNERLESTFACGYSFPEELLRNRLREGSEFVLCPLCEVRHPILTSGAESARLARPGLQDRVLALKTDVEAKTRIAVAEVKRDLRDSAGKSSDKIRILHVSDLHLRCGDSPAALLQPLIADLTINLKVKELDYLVVSGDLADRCDERAFRVASNFLSELRKAMGLAADRCILVPGNHDLKHELDGFQLKGEVDPSEDYIAQGAIFLTPDPANYTRRFRFFADCYKDFKLADYPLDPSRQAVVAPFEDTRIQFLALNSAWKIDQFRPKRSDINPVALAEGLLAAGRNSDYLGIAVWHHALTGRDQIQDTSFLDRLSQCGFKLCLHGDVHEFRPDMANPYGSSHMHIVGVGAFAAKAEDRPESVPRMYNLLEIARDRSSVRVRSRKQDASGQAFSAYAIWPVSGQPDVMRGDYEFLV